MSDDDAHSVGLREWSHWDIQLLGDAVRSMNMKAALWKETKAQITTKGIMSLFHRDSR